MKKIRINFLGSKSQVVLADSFDVSPSGNLNIYRALGDQLEVFAIIPALRWTGVWFIDEENDEE